MVSRLDSTEIDKAFIMLLNQQNPSNYSPPLQTERYLSQSQSSSKVQEGLVYSSTAPTDSNYINVSSVFGNNLSTQLMDVSNNLGQYNTLYQTMNNDKRYDFNPNAATKISADYIPGTRETALDDIQTQLDMQNRVYVYTSLGLFSLVIAGILMNNLSA